MTQRLQFTTIKISPWQFWLMGALGFAFTIALLILAAGLFLILAPVALVAALCYRLRGGGAPRPQADGVIETDYTVVNERAPKLDRSEKR